MNPNRGYTFPEEKWLLFYTDILLIKENCWFEFVLFPYQVQLARCRMNTLNAYLLCGK